MRHILIFLLLLGVGIGSLALVAMGYDDDDPDMERASEPMAGIARNLEAGPVQTRVAAVLEGDLIMVETSEGGLREVRVFGVDTPEDDQPYAEEAQRAATDYVLGKQVLVEAIQQFGQNVPAAMITPTSGGPSLSEFLLERGLAWRYAPECTRPECDKWFLVEKNAKQDRRGLWADPDPVAPWTWRFDKHYSPDAQQAQSKATQ